MKRLILGLMFVLASLPLAAPAAEPAVHPQLRLTTSLGAIELELYPDKAPLTVKNFLGYVDSGFYNGTIFHRVIPGFMIQGGGFRPGLDQKPAGAPIRNEAGNGLKNLAGTLAMARTSEPHSASAQFFINTVDNPALDHRDQSPRGWGYAVFGKVTKGLDVVKKIESVATGRAGPHQNVPQRDVVLEKIERLRTGG